MDNLRRVTWALRKARLPVSIEGLVLDVGAGSCPYPRSDILLERYVSGEHRCGANVVADRPIVFADAMRMPFRDKAFDFVVTSHVLEHVKSPELFLAELVRVGRAGYIETPNVFLERISPYTVHVLELMDVNGKLVINKKTAAMTDPFLASIRAYQHAKWGQFFRQAPDMFHVRHFWRGTIEYDIRNPEEPCDWFDATGFDDSGEVQETYVGGGWRGWGLRNLRRYYRWRRRAKPIDWLTILACPECRGQLERRGTELLCRRCVVAYDFEPVPNFLRPRPLANAQ